MAELGKISVLALGITGFALLLFAVGIGWVLARANPVGKIIKAISPLDFLWVTGNLSILAFRPFGASTAGLWGVTLIAMAVAIMGGLQYRALTNAG